MVWFFSCCIPNNEIEESYTFLLTSHNNISFDVAKKIYFSDMINDFNDYNIINNPSYNISSTTHIWHVQLNKHHIIFHTTELEKYRNNKIQIIEFYYEINNEFQTIKKSFFLIEDSIFFNLKK